MPAGTFVILIPKLFTRNVDITVTLLKTEYGPSHLLQIANPRKREYELSLFS